VFYLQMLFSVNLKKLLTFDMSRENYRKYDANIFFCVSIALFLSGKYK